jgi:hypothetical protein
MPDKWTPDLPSPLVCKYSRLLTMTGNEALIDTLYDEAIDLAEQCCVVSSKPRKTGRQRNRANSQVEDNKDY